MSRILITGASRGIGLALTKQFLQRGDQVTAVCRKPTAELQSAGADIIDDVDVTSAEDCQKLAGRIDYTIDTLINNAGLLENDSLGQIDFDSLRRQFEVNSIGPLQVTQALLSKLDLGSKVVMITSRMGSVGDNSSGGYYGYRMSKAALNMGAKSLSLDLKSRDIPVVLLHPGYVQTDMTGHSGYITAEESAALLMERIDDTSMSNTGTFRHAEGERLPW